MRSYASALAQGGFFYQTFVLVNTGIDAYSITGLLLFTGLDLTYFNMTNFNSAQAIGSGTLYENVISQTGTPLTIPSGGTLEFSFGAVSPATYSMLSATVQEILPGGGLGAVQNLALASSAVPEPYSQSLVLFSLICLCLVRLRLKKEIPGGVRSVGPRRQ